MYVACFLHDLEYWAGGTEDERLIADAELLIHVVKLGIAKRKSRGKMARVMYSGVRIGGGSAWRKVGAKYAWGFGNG
jgi:hypothetical protein